MVLERFPGTGVGSISRACNVGGTSEHKEGRAWDMSLSATTPAGRATADRIFEWLLKEDKFGNEAAMARRLGIMYFIWNKKIWGTWGGWETYCKVKGGVCKDPDDGGVLNPHTDHVHFSFTWDGAKKLTTYYNPSRSYIAGIAPSPDGNGYWLAARNGAVMPAGSAGYWGAKSDGYLDQPIVDIVPTTTGGGYWLMTRKGRVFALGDALYRGRPQSSMRAVGMATTPTGRGYWIAARSGRVQAFGKAEELGDVRDEDVTVVDIVATPTGLGYWLFTDKGRVFTFGDAQLLGGAADEELNSPVVAADNNGADGYWMVTESGRVLSYGTSHFFGGATDMNVDTGIVSITSSPLGDGYWLATTTGRVLSFGEASNLSASSRGGRGGGGGGGKAPVIETEILGDAAE
jgi:hypothetical protein